MLLRQYLQSTYAISRRTLTLLIDQKKIFLDDKLVESYNQSVLDGQRIKINDKQYYIDEIFFGSHKKSDSIIVLFNKPIGYVVSKKDCHNKTIYDLLPQKFKNYYYIGRLDKNSHGLLLLTNNSQLVYQFEHPKFGIEKEYKVRIDKFLSFQDKQKILKGIQDGQEILKVLKIKMSGNDIFITLNEGKKRHIRRIFKILGYHILDLQRIREGSFELGDLKSGKCKIIKIK